MIIFIWSTIFIASLIVLVKGADWLIDSAENIGVALGFSPFIVGILLVGVGTSFPELISSLAAVIKNVPEIVVANAVGSNIANIFLVVGFAAIMAKKLVVTKSLIDLDLPLLALATALMLGVTLDGNISTYEAIILLFGYIVYFFYTIRERSSDEDASDKDTVDIIPPSRHKMPSQNSESMKILRTPKILLKNLFLLIIGIIALIVGAKYLVDSVIVLSSLINVATSTIALIAIAFGTSLPEVVVSIKAALQHKSEMVLGNIFGSNVFNLLVVTGIPALFGNLPVDNLTLTLGLPVMIVATILFLISGISRRIHNWEGVLYILLYVLFVAKLLGL